LPLLLQLRPAPIITCFSLSAKHSDIRIQAGLWPEFSWVFFVLLYLAGYGIGGIISNNPVIGLILKAVSSAWLFYLAIVFSRPATGKATGSTQKIGFTQAFLLQFVNPKAWIMALSGAGAFMPQLGNIHLGVFVFAITFGLVGIPCMLAWIAFGDTLSRLLKSERSNKIVGVILFVLMLTSIVMIWL
jgi:threonine/homoserine/homoserine lactone efflux protein